MQHTHTHTHIHFPWWLPLWLLWGQGPAQAAILRLLIPAHTQPFQGVSPCGRFAGATATRTRRARLDQWLLIRARAEVAMSPEASCSHGVAARWTSLSASQHVVSDRVRLPFQLVSLGSWPSFKLIIRCSLFYQDILMLRLCPACCRAAAPSCLRLSSIWGNSQLVTDDARS